MATEVEAKFAVADPKAMRQRLARAGVRLGRPVLQEDVFFRRTASARADEALRLRREGSRLELTYKGPRRRGPTKARREETVRLASDPTPLLAALGYVPAARLAKRRRAGAMGRVNVAFDEVPGLGWFLELEVVAEGAVGAVGAVGAARAHVDAAARLLGLAKAPRIRASYVEMALGRRRAHR